MVQLLVYTTHQRIGQVDGCAVNSEKQSVVHCLDATDGTPLLQRQLMSKGGHALALIALQHEGIGNAVGQGEAATHPRLVVPFQLNLRIVIAEMERIVLSSWRMSHVDNLLEQRQCRLYGLHPRLRAAMQGLHLGYDLLTVGVVHLRKLRRKERIHLILLILVGDLHIGKGQESGREILGRGEGTLT